ncbi:MAG: RDD family protein [Longimicrobiaceae bacterium]
MECPLCRLRMKNRSYCPRCETQRLLPPEYLPPHEFPRVPVDYAGFGPRLGALLLDGLVLLPAWGASIWMQTRSPAGAVFGVVFALLVYEAYHVGLTATFGQTLGKRLMDIQVRRADGARVGWGRAFLRRLPTLLSEVAGVAVAVVVASVLTQAQFDDAGGIFDRMRMLTRAGAALNVFFHLPFGLYNLANAITFFTNDRYRALHDLIAGTVVVYE